MGPNFFLFVYSCSRYVFAYLFKRVGNLGLIERIGRHNEFTDILSLQFVDDTLLFYVGKHNSVLAAKTILLAFQASSELKINFYKSSIHCLHMTKGEVSRFVLWLNCKKRDFPFTYLGLPLY